MKSWPYVKHLFLKDRDFWTKPKYSSVNISTGLVNPANNQVYNLHLPNSTITAPTETDIQEANNIGNEIQHQHQQSPIFHINEIANTTTTSTSMETDDDDFADLVRNCC